jgi:Amino acid permease
MASALRFLALLVWGLARIYQNHAIDTPLGFECTPSYIEVIRPKDYSSILRNLIIVSAVLNTVLSFLACALLPVSAITDGTNVLSALGSLTGGSWLRILVLVDAISVLLGGVMTGTVTTIQLFDRMAQ